jgi:hypothetical protein
MTRQGLLLLFGFFSVALLTQGVSYACQHHPKGENVVKQALPNGPSPQTTSDDVIHKPVGSACHRCCGHCACCSHGLGGGECCGHCGEGCNECLCGCETPSGTSHPPASAPTRTRFLERDHQPLGSAPWGGFSDIAHSLLASGSSSTLEIGRHTSLYLCLQSIRC